MDTKNFNQAVNGRATLKYRARVYDHEMSEKGFPSLFQEDNPGENTATTALLFGVAAVLMTASWVAALAGAGISIAAMGLGLKYINDEEIEQTPKFERMARAGVVMGGFSLLASVVILLIQAS